MGILFIVICDYCMNRKKKILIVGSGPLPNDQEGIREAAGLRTQQFIDPLRQRGHDVSLFCIHNKEPLQKEECIGEMNIWRSCRTDKTLFRQVRHVMSNLKPDVTIGVNTFPSFVISQMSDGNIPFWADLNGWIMAEAHARSWSEETDVHFANAWRQEKAILLAADCVSCVSEAQKFCTIGELASIGQFRHDNFLEKRVIALQNCTKWFDIDRDKTETDVEAKERQKEDNVDMSKAVKPLSKIKEREEIMFTKKQETMARQEQDNVENKKNKTSLNKQKTSDSDIFDKTKTSSVTQNMFRKKSIPEDAFVVAWIGGYNNWVDEKLLFEGVENAMKEIKNLYFVSTGGAIAKVADDTFGRFRQMIDMSNYKHRFIFLGWIETENMKKVYAESDVGINIDFECIETESGARNRINEMMKFGLPVITTNGSEIGKAVGMYDAGISVPYEKGSQNITNAIIEMANMSKEERMQKGKNGQYYTFEKFPESIVMQPVLEFVENPWFSNKKTIPLEGIILMIQNIWWYAKKHGLKTLWAKILQKMS